MGGGLKGPNVVIRGRGGVMVKLLVLGRVLLDGFHKLFMFLPFFWRIALGVFADFVPLTGGGFLVVRRRLVSLAFFLFNLFVALDCLSVSLKICCCLASRGEGERGALFLVLLAVPFGFFYWFRLFGGWL